WSCIHLRDETRGTFHLASSVGLRPEVHAELEHVELSPRAMPLVGALQAGALLELSAGDGRDSAELLRRYEAASALCAPLARRARVMGLLLCGHRERTGRFSVRQNRLCLGIAHAAAIALENTRLIADLQAASRLKSDFVATMSHELRTPLNVITGYTDLLVEGAFGDLSQAQQDTLARVRRNALALHDL